MSVTHDILCAKYSKYFDILTCTPHICINLSKLHQKGGMSLFGNTKVVLYTFAIFNNH